MTNENCTCDFDAHDTGTGHFNGCPTTRRRASEDGIDRSEYFRQLFVAAFDAWEDSSEEKTGSFGDDWKIRPNPPLPTARPLYDVCAAERHRFGKEGVTLKSVEASLWKRLPLRGRSQGPCVAASLEPAATIERHHEELPRPAC